MLPSTGSPQAFKEIKKFARKEIGTPDVHMDSRFYKAVWAHGIRTVLNLISTWLPRKHNEDEDSPNKLYTLFSMHLSPL